MTLWFFFWQMLQICARSQLPREQLELDANRKQYFLPFIASNECLKRDFPARAAQGFPAIVVSHLQLAAGWPK
jgi:hypothetical protein